MPVITHRRVNEMRSSRRRLSVGVVGAYGTAALGSPRSNTFSTSRHTLDRGSPIPKEFGERAPDSPGRRNSARLSSSLDSAAICYEPSVLTRNRTQRASTVASAHGQDDVDGPDVVTSASPSKSPNEECGSSATDCSASRYPLAISPNGPLCLKNTPSTTAAQNSPLLQGTQQTPTGIAIPLTYEGIMCHEDPSGSFDEDADCNAGDGSDDEVRNELLPTPEQLIFSQSWSTWPTPSYHLYSGSKFSGFQSNGTRSYKVSVTMKYVDMGVPELCGHFTIRGLTTELPKLTTYFDAQIIGTGSHSFVTKQWDATADTDRTHWGFFPAFRQYRNKFDSKDFKYALSTSDKHIFMRWKERFVVPNYKISRINGASYDGFYYVCYDKENASITGYYYHKESEQYQCLKLSHVKQTSFSHFELA